MQVVDIKNIMIGDDVVICKILAAGAYRFSVKTVYDKKEDCVMVTGDGLDGTHYPNEDGYFIIIDR